MTSVYDFGKGANLIYDIETTGLDYLTHRIVAIGCKEDNRDEIKIFFEEDEKKLLTSFWEYVHSIHPCRFVGFNNHFFDDPFVFYRTLSNDIPNGFPLFAYNNSVDLRVVLNEFKMRSSTVKRGTLTHFCNLFSIPCSEDQFSGKDVPELWEDRHNNSQNIDVIKKHCRLDIEKTFLLYNKMRCFL